MKKAYHTPHQFKKRRPFFKNVLFWIIFLIILFSSGICYLLYFSDFFQVKNVIISGNEKIDGGEVEKLILNEIGNKFIIFPSQSIFLTDFNKLNGDILENFPGITNVTLERKFPNSISVKIEERKPVAIFSQTRQIFLGTSTSNEAVTIEQKFSLDNQGIIFEIAPENNDLPEIINSQNSDYYNLGQKIIDQQLLKQILEIEGKLRLDLKIPVQDFDIASNEKLTVDTNDGWQIYFNPQGDINWQLTKLKAVLDEKIPIEKMGDLEYIDLQFGNFAPFKYR